MSVINLDASNYHKLIQSDAPILVEFSAPWCVYCRRLAPIFSELSTHFEDQVIFGVVNADDEPALTNDEKVEVLPTLIMYHKGKILNKITAPNSRKTLEDFINESLNRQNENRDSDTEIYDMIVVGGGPGGYTAALYASRAGLSTIVIEQLSAGGQVALTEQVDNYPGFEEGITGIELGEKMRNSAERFGVKTLIAQVLSTVLNESLKKVKTDKRDLYGRTVVIATGATPRKLGIDGEEELTGKGVSYCALCDGMFYRDKTVVVVGGGNSAAEDAIILSRICKKVMLVHRRNTMRADKIYQDMLMNIKNVEFYWDSTVIELIYNERLNSIRLRDVNTSEEQNVECYGIFISIGRTPATNIVKGQINLDTNGYIIADESTKCNISGVFAVGDVRTKAVRQIVTAVSDGAFAAHYAEEFLINNK